MAVSLDELLRLFSKSFYNDLKNLLFMLDTNGFSLDDVRLHIYKILDKTVPSGRCPICGRPLREDKCCANKGRMVCQCGYVE